ncbi:MAG TPA: nucleotide exchange factor GrpE [bacterium]|nr:nucleotide exchange factor GrpE [bacterium]HOL49413.1 nucleotide exchange factor GrpE [bacterium]HXK45251.1 nucleotide exchange factor GrpE [bacterium]
MRNMDKNNKEKIIHIREKDFRRIAAFRSKARKIENKCTALEEKIAGMEKELSEWKERATRLAAEMENLRKRIEKEKQEFSKFIQASFAEKLLFFDEIFEKVVNDVCSDKDINKNVADGLVMLKKQFTSLLESLGVQKIETQGKVFDPMIHEAVETVETDEKPEGTIIEEVRAGYTINGKLLKPAQVKVVRGKNKDTGSSKN